MVRSGAAPGEAKGGQSQQSSTQALLRLRQKTLRAFMNRCSACPLIGRARLSPAAEICVDMPEPLGRREIPALSEDKARTVAIRNACDGLADVLLDHVLGSEKKRQVSAGVPREASARRGKA